MKRRILQIILVLTALVILGGCTTLQTVQKVNRTNFNNVCIVEHTAVREEVLAAIQEVLNSHGTKTQIVAGSYVKNNNMWYPTYQIKDVTSCDAVLFYVANWTWDIVMYMHFANIWVVSPDEKKTSLGGATYNARLSLNKFINARQKIMELTTELLGADIVPHSKQVAVPQQPKDESRQAVVPKHSNESGEKITTVPESTLPFADTSARDDSAQLEKLKNLMDRGIISEEEFSKKKKEILDRM